MPDDYFCTVPAVPATHGRHAGPHAPADVRPDDPFHVPPPTNLAMAIVALGFFLPTALVAVVAASHVEGLWANGYERAAQAESEKAKKWAVVSFIVGAAVIVLALTCAPPRNYGASSVSICSACWSAQPGSTSSAVIRGS
jgi:hypothetical protein